MWWGLNRHIVVTSASTIFWGCRRKQHTPKLMTKVLRRAPKSIVQEPTHKNWCTHLLIPLEYKRRLLKLQASREFSKFSIESGEKKAVPPAVMMSGHAESPFCTHASPKPTLGGWGWEENTYNKISGASLRLLLCQTKENGAVQPPRARQITHFSSTHLSGRDCTKLLVHFSKVGWSAFYWILLEKEHPLTQAEKSEGFRQARKTQSEFGVWWLHRWMLDG